MKKKTMISKKILFFALSMLVIPAFSMWQVPVTRQYATTLENIDNDVVILNGYLNDLFEMAARERQDPRRKPSMMLQFFAQLKNNDIDKKLRCMNFARYMQGLVAPHYKELDTMFDKKCEQPGEIETAWRSAGSYLTKEVIAARLAQFKENLRKREEEKSSVHKMVHKC